MDWYLEMPDHSLPPKETGDSGAFRPFMISGENIQGTAASVEAGRMLGTSCGEDKAGGIRGVDLGGALLSFFPGANGALPRCRVSSLESQSTDGLGCLRIIVRL